MLHSSGIGTYLQELVPRVLASRPDWSFVLLGSRVEAGDWPSVDREDIRWVGCGAPIYSLREQWEVPQAVPRETDLLWVPHFNVPVRYKGRLLVTVHDVFHLAQRRFAGRGPKRWAAQFLLEAVKRKADAILTPSEFTAGEFRRWVGEPRSLTVTPLAAGPLWSQSLGGATPHPRPYFLFVGNVKPHKNLAGLLDAFASVQGRIPHDLVVAGKKEGFLSGDAGSVERAKGMEGRVLFLGALEPEVLKRWVAFAQAAVLPSFYEGFGLPPLEAMAMGTPVVVSNRASLPEVCADAALYVDPDKTESIAEALERIANEQTLRTELSRKGLARAATFSWDATLQKTLPVLDGLIGKPTISSGAEVGK